MNEKEENLKELVLEKEQEGKVVVLTASGLAETEIDNLLNQPAGGILYDLNRDKATVLTYIDKPKWVNDYAVGLVITRLKERIAELEE